MSDTTWMQCYGIIGQSEQGFTPRSDLIQKNWAIDPQGKYVQLSGRWKDNSMTATTENYFVAEKINGHAVTDSALHSTLAEVARRTIQQTFRDEYADNVAYFASDNSVYGYEYPILSATQEKAIKPASEALNYSKILRYAFAASYVYSQEAGADPFAFIADVDFRALMLREGQQAPEIVDQMLIPGGMHAIAIRAPAVPHKGLEEEIIIAYKGTSNRGDVWQDIKLMLTNLAEFDNNWQRTAWEFCQRVLQRYPANEQSIMPGYQPMPNGRYNLVLTGHSLGAYTATDVAVRSGLPARVFSSPATSIIRKYSKVFANQMRLNNVVNFVRQLDPVSGLSGRHDENMVFFPAASGASSLLTELAGSTLDNLPLLLQNPAIGATLAAGQSGYDALQSHFLTPFIQDELLPCYHQQAQAHPSYVYITPDVMVAAGITAPVNHWGAL